MKLFIPKFIFPSTLAIFSLLLLSSTLLQADELQIGIFKATSEKSLKAISKDLAVVYEDQDDAADTEDSNEVEESDTAEQTDTLYSDNPVSLTPADEYERETFEVGDYVVICFTPPVSLHFRIVDIAPDSKESVIFPIDGSVARKVSAGSRFCVGNENSDTLLQMDSGSGSGKGTVWIIGTATEAQSANLDLGDFSLPAVGKGGLAPAGSKMVGKNRVEGWIDYEVK